MATGDVAGSASNGTTSAVGSKSGSNSGGYRRIVYVICAVAALGGLLFGLDQGFIANSLATIDAHYHLGVQGGESYSAILATGGIIGALLSGIFARFLGRKRSLLLAGFIFAAASATLGDASAAAGALGLPLRPWLRGRCCVLYRAAIPGRNCPSVHPRLDGYALSVDDHYWDLPDLAD